MSLNRRMKSPEDHKMLIDQDVYRGSPKQQHVPDDAPDPRRKPPKSRPKPRTDPQKEVRDVAYYWNLLRTDRFFFDFASVKLEELQRQPGDKPPRERTQLAGERPKWVPCTGVALKRWLQEMSVWLSSSNLPTKEWVRLTTAAMGTLYQEELRNRRLEGNAVTD